MRKNEIEFLRRSNYMENERGIGALMNSICAWEYAKSYDGKINTSYILNIHRRLMMRINPEIAGKIRDVPIGVTNQIYSCLEPEKVRSYLRAWANLGYNSESEIEDLHLLFMIIHPFEDGNGRTGRILMNVQRLRRDLPVFVLDEGHKTWYYQYYLLKRRKGIFRK